MPHTHRHDTRYKASQGEGAQANTEANMEVRETQPTTEIEVSTNNTLEIRQERMPHTEPEQPRQTERVTQTGNANLLEMMRAIMEDNQKKMEETFNRSNESLNKKLDDNNKNIESLKERVNKKFDDNNKNNESLKEDNIGRIWNLSLIHI